MTEDTDFRLFRLAAAMLLVAASFAVALSGCAAGGMGTKGPQAGASQGMEDRWGVRVEGVRLTADGYMLDFRYRVTDPAKAAYILDPSRRPVLVDAANGARLGVPALAKVGSLRQTSNNGRVLAGRSYYIIFANPGRGVSTGARVSVEIGDFRADGLTVE